MIQSKIRSSMRLAGVLDFVRNVEADVCSPYQSHESQNLHRVFQAMTHVMRTPTLVAGIVMPDACSTGDYSIPVGGVVVAENAIHPGFHSSDICCSVMATNLGPLCKPADVLNVAQKVTHFGRGGRTRSSGFFKLLTQELQNRIRCNPFFSDNDLKKAQLHLGTQGDGNHFLFVGRSEQNGGVTVVTHHGSRALGASLFESGKKIAQRLCQSICPEVDAECAWIPADSPEGESYWDALQIVRDWTKLNHHVIHQRIIEKLGLNSQQLANSSARIWNEHNFVFRRPSHLPGQLDQFIHAKGATPMDDMLLPDSRDGLRLIPLNMSQPILIARGIPNSNGFGFAPHGAGRNMSRAEHKKLRRKSGQTDEEIFYEETKGIDVRFYSGKVDISELPSAYKSAEQVQQQIAKFNLASIVDRIMPIGCIMAGSAG